MRIRTHAIHPRLAPYVRLIWTLEAGDVGSDARPERVLPDGIVEAVFHAGAPWSMRFADASFARQPQSFAIFQTHRFIELRPAAQSSFVSVRFQPWGASHFFDRPPSAFCDAAIPGPQLWGRDGVRLEERLADAATTATRVRLVEQFLLLQLKRRRDVAPLVRAVWQNRGQARIATIGRTVGVSERQLERIFLREVGVSPKHFARLARFLHSCHLLRHRPDRSLTQLAHAAGFYDQSHFIREFQALGRMTPREYRLADDVAALTID